MLMLFKTVLPFSGAAIIIQRWSMGGQKRLKSQRAAGGRGRKEPSPGRPWGCAPWGCAPCGPGSAAAAEHPPVPRAPPKNRRREKNQWGSIRARAWIGLAGLSEALLSVLLE